VKAVRDIIRAEDKTDAEKVRALLDYVMEAGLPMPPQPLPPVRIEDVRVICWMTVIANHTPQ
jgi:hypothetical protein